MIERVVPMFISTGNAEIVTGQSWRWCKDMARSLGVPVVSAGKKQLVDAAKFRAALEALTAENTPEGDTTANPAAALRERLGLRRVL